MRDEWVKNLLDEAQNTFDKPVIYNSVDALEEAPLELQCRYLLEAFRSSADWMFFEGVYRLTWPLFTWFSGKCLKKTESPENIDVIINSFYSMLCEYTLQPDSRIPKENLLGWCYTLIENLTMAKTSKGGKDGSEAINRQYFYPSEQEAWMRYNELAEAERLEERVIEVLITNDARLVDIEREALTLYYGNGLSIRELSARIGLSEDRAFHLLQMSREKVLEVVYRTESRRMKYSEQEERQ